MLSSLTAGPVFDPLNGYRSAQQRSNDGLSAEQILQPVPVLQCTIRVFKPKQQLGANRRAANCRNYDGPARRSCQKIARSVALESVQPERDKVS